MNIQTRLSAKTRNNLSDVLPLQQPYVLLVDPSSLCNLRCRWCPSGYDDLIAQTKRAQQSMPFDLFEKIVQQAAEFESPFKVLRLYKEGEPLINPCFENMVERAKNSGCFLCIDTTTNGFLLTPERNRKLVQAGIDQINISVNGVNAEQIYKHTGRKVDFEAYVKNIQDLCEHRGKCTIYIKSIKDVLTEPEQEKFFRLFGDLADRVYLERLSPAWPDFNVDLSGYQYEAVGNYEQPIENRKVCPYLFYIMAVNADGSVSTCVGDWKHHQIVGDIRIQTLKDVWLGEKQRSYQLAHLRGNKDDFELCRVCQVITHGCYDNIDREAGEIIKKMTEVPKAILSENDVQKE